VEEQLMRRSPSSIGLKSHMPPSSWARISAGGLAKRSPPKRASLC